jgi:hypothetical protein
MTYEEINPTIWKHEKEGDFIEGFLVRIQENIGVNDSSLYSVDTSNGIKNVWGSAILDERMALVKVGEKIRITFKGLGQAKEGRNSPKIYKVEIDKSAQRV